MNDTPSQSIEDMIKDVEAIYAKRGITDDEKNMILVTISAFCHYQLESRQGLFFENVKHLLREPS